jgi:hypothetical protein
LPRVPLRLGLPPRSRDRRSRWESADPGQPSHVAAAQDARDNRAARRQGDSARGFALAHGGDSALILDARTNKWFVRFGVMVSHEILPHLSLSAGVAVSLLADNPQYNNIVYGRVALSF